MDLLDKDFKSPIFNIFQRAKGNHVWRTEGKYENDISANKEYHQRDTNYKKESNINSGVKNTITEIKIYYKCSAAKLSWQKGESEFKGQSIEILF